MPRPVEWWMRVDRREVTEAARALAQGELLLLQGGPAAGHEVAMHLAAEVVTARAWDLVYVSAADLELTTPKYYLLSVLDELVRSDPPLSMTLAGAPIRLVEQEVVRALRDNSYATCVLIDWIDLPQTHAAAVDTVARLSRIAADAACAMIVGTPPAAACTPFNCTAVTLRNFATDDITACLAAAAIGPPAQGAILAALSPQPAFRVAPVHAYTQLKLMQP